MVKLRYPFHKLLLEPADPDSEVGLLERHYIGNLSIAQAVDIHEENVSIELFKRPDEVFEDLDLVPGLRADKSACVILRWRLHGSLKGATMLPVEVAGGIKRDAVNPGCKARFSFVSVKASPELENYFLQEIAPAVSRSVALGDEYQSFPAFSLRTRSNRSSLSECFLKAALLYPYISNGRKPNVTKGSKKFAPSQWALWYWLSTGAERADFQPAFQGVIFIIGSPPIAISPLWSLAGFAGPTRRHPATLTVNKKPSTYVDQEEHALLPCGYPDVN
jgi:hypothetical protein